MTELDHGDFPITVRMTSQLFHTLFLSAPSHIQLILPTSSNVIANEYDGIHSPDMSRIMDVCADTLQHGATPSDMSRDIDLCADTHHDASPPVGKYTNLTRSTVVPSSSRSQNSQQPRTHAPTSNDNRMCLHAHMSMSSDRRKCPSTHLPTDGVPLTCHVMVPCHDPESTYRRNPGSHTNRII
jgi:hypothetical protein